MIDKKPYGCHVQTVWKPATKKDNFRILNGEKIFDIEGAARELGIEKSTLYNLNSKRKISFMKPGKECLYTEKHLLDYIKSIEVLSENEIRKSVNL